MPISFDRGLTELVFLQEISDRQRIGQNELVRFELFAVLRIFAEVDLTDAFDLFDLLVKMHPFDDIAKAAKIKPSGPAFDPAKRPRQTVLPKFEAEVVVNSTYPGRWVFG